jgi:hypothetical protein
VAQRPVPLQAFTVYAAYWKRLWKAPVSNHLRIFAYRLSHAALPCAAMKGFMRNAAMPAVAACPLCPAPGGRSPRPLETYTHLFMECPAYRPAVNWLLDVWQAVSGVRPPESATVVIADDWRSWPDAPEGPRAALWTALRLTVLFSIWSARMSKDSQQQTAAAVVRSAIAMLRAEMHLQFNRVQLHGDLALDIPQQLLRVHSEVQPTEDSFINVWVNGGMCRRQPAVEDGQAETLEVLLTDTHPVAAPD